MGVSRCRFPAGKRFSYQIALSCPKWLMLLLLLVDLRYMAHSLRLAFVQVCWNMRRREKLFFMLNPRPNVPSTGGALHDFQSRDLSRLLCAVVTLCLEHSIKCHHTFPASCKVRLTGLLVEVIILLLELAARPLVAVCISHPADPDRRNRFTHLHAATEEGERRKEGEGRRKVVIYRESG